MKSHWSFTHHLLPSWTTLCVLFLEEDVFDLGKTKTEQSIFLSLKWKVLTAVFASDAEQGFHFLVLRRRGKTISQVIPTASRGFALPLSLLDVLSLCCFFRTIPWLQRMPRSYNCKSSVLIGWTLNTMLHTYPNKNTINKDAYIHTNIHA